MNPGANYIFRVQDVNRERLPVMSSDVIGREIELRDQIGTMRLKSGDVVKLLELRADGHTCLCSHSACHGVILTDVNSLHELP